VTSLAVQDFATRSIMPAEDVLELDARKPGFLDAAIADAIEFDIYARLRKRYVVPFPEPAPRVVGRSRRRRQLGRCRDELITSQA